MIRFTVSKGGSETEQGKIIKWCGREDGGGGCKLWLSAWWANKEHFHKQVNRSNSSNNFPLGLFKEMLIFLAWAHRGFCREYVECPNLTPTSWGSYCMVSHSWKACSERYFQYIYASLFPIFPLNKRDYLIKLNKVWNTRHSAPSWIRIFLPYVRKKSID